MTPEKSASHPMPPSPPANLEQAILAAIGTQPGIGLAILFGSLALGAGRPESDLDLAVDAGHSLTASEKITLISALAETTGRPVDLVDLQSVGEPLLGQILRHGKRLLGSDTQYANLIRRHVFDQADFLPYRNRILTERRQAWIGK
jgi:predicted nucleotidyltransferase